MNASVEARLITRIEDFARAEKRSFSAVLGDVISLGTKDYEEILSKRQFAKDLAVVKEAERIRATQIIREGGQHEESVQNGLRQDK